MSILSNVVKLILKLSGRKNNFNELVLNKNFNLKPAPLLGKYRKEFNVSTEQVNGRNVISLSSNKNETKKHVIYIHGGAYVNNITQHHWNLITTLVRKTNANFVVPDYPLAAEDSASVEVSFKLLEKIYKDLLKKVSAEDIILMGDSAGGGFSLALAQQFNENNIEQPSQIILISPWLDVSMTNLDIKPVEKKDVILDVQALEVSGKLWAGIKDIKDPLVSPIYGALENLGKISLFIGTHDILIADCRKFKEIMSKKGISFNYFEYPKMFHVWVALTILSEAKSAIRKISDLIKN